MYKILLLKDLYKNAKFVALCSYCLVANGDEAYHKILLLVLSFIADRVKYRHHVNI